MKQTNWEKNVIEIQKILEPYFVVLDGRDNTAEHEAVEEISFKLEKLFKDLLEEQKKEFLEMIPKERNSEHKNQKTNIRARLCQWFDNGFNECRKQINKKYE